MLRHVHMVDQAMAAAQAEDAGMLAPQKFKEGLKRYHEAEKRFEQGAKLASIYAELNTALAAFQQAKEATRLARVTFSSALEARADAEEAGAPQFAAKVWHKAEEKLLDAAKKLEEGDLNGVGKANYLLENLEVYRPAIVAIGYGNTSPIPSHELTICAKLR